MPLPPLKTDPKYGYFPWWPEDGDDWVHPEDVAIARSLIPSGRIFRRDGDRGDFVVMYYGEIRLRVRPKLWQEVEPEGFELGDWVEVLSLGMRNEPRTGVIRDVMWDTDARGIRYFIRENELPIAEHYAADELRHVKPTEPLNR